MKWWETAKLFKHEAIAGIPFNLEVILNKFYSMFTIMEARIKNLADDIVFSHSGFFAYDLQKNMYYVENVVINEPGIYYSEFILNKNGNSISIKEQFKVTSLNLVDGWIPRTYVKFVKGVSIPELEKEGIFPIIVYLYSDEPVLFLDEVHVIHTDIAKQIKPIWTHQVAPQVFKIVISLKDLKSKFVDEQQTKETFAIAHTGVLSVEMKLYGLLRDEPYIITSSLSFA